MHTLAVIATAYCLVGTTASGVQTHPGSVAVDPRVIPLRSFVVVPGYGAGRADDTGSAIRGARVDVWFASCARARRWGRRLVVIRWSS